MAVSLCLAAVAFAQTRKPQTPPARPKSGAAKQAPKARTSPAAKKRTTAKKSRVKRPRPSRQTTQRAPTRERYAEIQQALIARGYLQAPASGVWGAESIEALKRFQQDQHLTPTGKLDALSLIALGLGPKRASGDGANAPPAGVSNATGESKQPQ